MANSLRCKVCGNDRPTAFSLVSGMKLPLCREHVATSSLPTYPIDSIAFVDYPTDLPLYRSHVSQLNSALSLLEIVQENEALEAEEMAGELESMKKAAVDLIMEEFENMAERGEKYHLEISKRIISARNELAEAKRVRRESLSVMARVAQKYAGVQQVGGIYVKRLKNMVEKLRGVVRKTAPFLQVDPTELLVETLSTAETQEPTFVKYFGRPSRIPVEREHKIGRLLFNPNIRPVFAITREGSPPPAKRPRPLLQEIQRGECKICKKHLTDLTYFPAEGHLDCKVCFDCIHIWSNMYLDCPLCKLKYNRVVRMELERRIPAALKRKRTLSEVFPCAECRNTEIPMAHKCPDGWLRCLICCQRTVVVNEQQRPGVCPRCGIVYPGEVFSLFDRERHVCAGCRRPVGLKNVAEWADTRQGVKLLCIECEGNVRLETWFLDR